MSTGLFPDVHASSPTNTIYAFSMPYQTRWEAEFEDFARHWTPVLDVVAEVKNARWEHSNSSDSELGVLGGHTGSGDSRRFWDSHMDYLHSAAEGVASARQLDFPASNIAFDGAFWGEA